MSNSDASAGAPISPGTSSEYNTENAPSMTTMTTNGICQSQADIGPPINCLGNWQPLECEAKPPHPYSALNCAQDFIITNSSRNGGKCPFKGGHRQCFTGACSVLGCDGEAGSGKAYDLCGTCGGECTADDEPGCISDGIDCLAKGCDDVIGSSIRFDICGECGGDGKSCLDAIVVAPTDGFSCLSCPAGKTNNATGRALCDSCDVGKYSASGEISCTECEAGRYRGSRDIPSRCLGCQPGKYMTEKGQPFCLDCPLGNFSGRSGANTCASCRSGTYSDKSKQKSCKQCAKTFEEPNEGKTACKKGNYKVPTDCGSEQYLDTTSSTNRASWKCKACPPGGWCDNNMNLTHTFDEGTLNEETLVYNSTWVTPGVKAKFGWSRCPNKISFSVSI